ncbi:rod shape-determining protein MreD [Marinitenerispora sediminis]|uniref:Rod shape-determining protein MreD n=1 Tax=Marinitenerispora sediminis TaxID=1931232 RepID=A0A368T3D8_9ACTN|nr:rod shape-determining protein MreD [Marinitenerispora sediminis]RCV52932.1 rod shape-determining protein MreD [Marinitenerispora sediminis]RCV53880.1 rod shape-determining protein MreD [Marinitenerispora sediminis]RCV57043.1 rod shape-determining protein MreD [Marinitenerispora sediminis]
MIRRTLAAVLVAVAVLLQTVVVNRLPMPWGVGPDLALLTVVAVAMRTTAVTGAVAGFLGGLAIDILPPADHELGRYALVLCLAGYLAGALRDPISRAGGLWPFGVAALATAGVSLGFAGVGVVLGDPRVTLGGVLGVLPPTLLLTMVVSPFVLYPVFWMLRRTERDDFRAVGATPWANGGIVR